MSMVVGGEQVTAVECGRYWSAQLLYLPAAWVTAGSGLLIVRLAV